MTLLIVGIVAFLGLHFLPAFPHLREGLIERVGNNAYRGVFSLLSLVSFALLVWGFAVAPVIQVWTPPPWTRWVAIVDLTGRPPDERSAKLLTSIRRFLRVPGCSLQD